MQNNTGKIILGIDPGYDRLGVCVLFYNGDSSGEVIYSGCISSQKKDTFEKRLYAVCSEVEKLFSLHTISAIALEDVFFQNNQKTATKVAEVRGALKYIAQNKGVPLFEYTPNQIKVAVTGNGRGDKTAMRDMLEKMLILEEKKRLDDEFDAIGIALTCAVSER